MNLPLYGIAAAVDFSVSGLLVLAPESQASWNTLLVECLQLEIPAASSLQIQCSLTSCDSLFQPCTDQRSIFPGNR